jgi:hypothetical protein
METSVINRIPECDPLTAYYMVIVGGLSEGLNVTRYYKEWEYASNVYEAYRQALKPEFQNKVRLVRMTSVIDPGEIMDWN